MRAAKLTRLQAAARRRRPPCRAPAPRRPGAGLRHRHPEQQQPNRRDHRRRARQSVARTHHMANQTPDQQGGELVWLSEIGDSATRCRCQHDQPAEPIKLEPLIQRHAQRDHGRDAEGRKQCMRQGPRPGYLTFGTSNDCRGTTQQVQRREPGVSCENDQAGRPLNGRDGSQCTESQRLDRNVNSFPAPGQCEHQQQGSYCCHCGVGINEVHGWECDGQSSQGKLTQLNTRPQKASTNIELTGRCADGVATTWRLIGKSKKKKGPERGLV